MKTEKKKINAEDVIIKAKFSFKRNIALIIGIIAPIVTYIYSYSWSSQRFENPFDGLNLGYFQSYYVGLAVFCFMLAFHLLFASNKAIVTKDCVCGKFSLIGKATIPLAAIESVKRNKNKVIINVEGGNSYSLAFVSNTEEVVKSLAELIKTSGAVRRNTIAEKIDNPKREPVNWVKPTYKYVKKVLILVVVGLIIVLSVCSSEGLFYFSSSSSKSSKSWSELSDKEKDNARWAYYAKQAIEEREKGK